MRWLWMLVFFVGCGGDKEEESGTPTDTLVDEDEDGVVAGTDCDDTNADVFPGAIEVCDGIDQDCDTEIDEEAADALAGWADVDGDGYGDSEVPLLACELPTASATVDGDCDDSDPGVHPTALELCNGVDDDCDLGIDEDATDPIAGFMDVDGDGYGDPAAPVSGCTLPTGAVTNSEDCDDLLSSVHPLADELCNGVSDDCDLEIDEDPIDPLTGYADRDLDGYGDAFTSVSDCTLPPGYILTSGDCDDGNPDRKPGNVETCDFVDNDCDFVVDESSVDAPTFYADLDGDGFGDPSNTLDECDAPAGYLEDDSDCYDASLDVFPGQTDYFDVDRGDGSFDYDCSGAEEAEKTGAFYCKQLSPGIEYVLSWLGGEPGCGNQGTLVTGVDWGCSITGTTKKIQTCR